MAVPRSVESRLYYRCAYQRMEEAQILLRSQRTTGAVYLAGYGVECILKALVLSAVPSVGRNDVLRSFRGTRGHGFVWLREVYLQNGGARFPMEVNEAFTLVSAWTTNLRYVPRTLERDEADDFLSAAGRILVWANRRL